jgi:hypothetical protein
VENNGNIIPGGATNDNWISISYKVFELILKHKDSQSGSSSIPLDKVVILP